MFCDLLPTEWLLAVASVLFAIGTPVLLSMWAMKEKA